MLNIKRLLVATKLCLRYCSSQPADIIVASAVRTPFANCPNEENSVAANMLALATDAAIKQAALPREVIDELHIITDGTSHTLHSELLRKDVVFSSYNSDYEALRAAVCKLKRREAKSIVIAGIDCILADNITNQTRERLNLATIEGLYDAEIVPILLPQKQRQMITLTHDELKTSEAGPWCIATAIALTTSENAAFLNLKPLARLLNVTHSSSQDYYSLIQQLLAPVEINVQKVHHWEMESNDLDLGSACIHTNSIPGIFGRSSVSNSVALQLIHLVHKLKSKQLGCLITSRIDGSSTGILLDNPNKICDNLPLLTVYTKDPCPLCDILIEELENSFHNEYRLEKVFIDQKENVRFLRLYRYDIPVLFFNGQFICMHRLNSKLLRRKIEETENNKLKRAQQLLKG